MDSINEIQGQEGLYKISKIKILYEANMTGNLMYIRNLENNKIVTRRSKQKRV